MRQIMSQLKVRGSMLRVFTVLWCKNWSNWTQPPYRSQNCSHNTKKVILQLFHWHSPKQTSSTGLHLQPDWSFQGAPSPEMTNWHRWKQRKGRWPPPPGCFWGSGSSRLRRCHRFHLSARNGKRHRWCSGSGLGPGRSEVAQRPHLRDWACEMSATEQPETPGSQQTQTQSWVEPRQHDFALSPTQRAHRRRQERVSPSADREVTIVAFGELKREFGIQHTQNFPHRSDRVSTSLTLFSTLYPPYAWVSKNSVSAVWGQPSDSSE